MINEDLENEYHETQIETAKTKLKILENELTKTNYLIEYSLYSAKIKKLKYEKMEGEL